MSIFDKSKEAINVQSGRKVAVFADIRAADLHSVDSRESDFINEVQNQINATVVSTTDSLLKSFTMAENASKQRLSKV